MAEAYDGRGVVGIDLRRRRSVVVRMSGDGRKLETVRIASSPAALRREIAGGRHPRVVAEAAYGWYRAADVLAAAGAEVHLAPPPGVQAYGCRRVKNDQRDAADLAGLLRMGRLPEAWIAPPEIREVPLPSERCTTLIRAGGRDMPGLSAVMAGSVQRVIFPRKIAASTGPVRCSRAPAGRDRL